MRLIDQLGLAVTGIGDWAAGYGSVEPHDSLHVSDERTADVLGDLLGRLHDNNPFFHPRYAGQMLKPPHPVAMAAYVAAMQVNPNAHALDGGPATAALEREVVSDLAEMFGYQKHLGHLTSSGTIANLEALFVARSLHPDRGLAFSAEAHYTHARMCSVLGMQSFVVPADVRGRMDLEALEEHLAAGRVGTVVATAGTTGLGAVDQVQTIVELAQAHGARVHVDSAYGGFFRLLADPVQPLVEPQPWLSIANADSVVVDPHKHGLQPYGCGAVLFRDPSVGRFYDHDSPYTYFTSDELHLGEISLECSRAGASAAALWATLQALPLTRDGLGAQLAATRAAGLALAARLAADDRVALLVEPELDIVCCLARRAPDPSAAAERAFATLAADGWHVATVRLDTAWARRRHPWLPAGAATVTALRCCLLKPEHLGVTEALADALIAALDAA